MCESQKQYVQSLNNIFENFFIKNVVYKVLKNYTAVNKEKGRWKKFFICHNLHFASRGIDLLNFF